MNLNTNIKIVVLLSVVLLLSTGFFLYKDLRFNNSYNGYVYNKEASDFTLTGHNGNQITLSQFKNKIVVLLFGYTKCPDICPMTLSMLKNTVSEVGHLQDKVQVLFITIDPERDTINKLESYVTYFDEQFIGLTGTPKEIEKVARDYHITYIKEYGESKAGYMMSHTVSVYLIYQEEQLLLVYPNEKLDYKLIAKDIKRIL